MISERRYRLIDKIAGWTVFIIAMLTYMLTLEPTVSYWDCGEYVAQAAMLEVGHPPGNPIFMLAGRVFCNFASDVTQLALMVNAMSGVLSALTILLLYWTITMLVSRFCKKESGYSLASVIAIVGSGVVGSLAYTWSDTFWFSAVEAEVYAFSSFCTALVVWLALKWEQCADKPHSDRYLILIAYIIGVSVAVHLLNLLCIPAIALIFAYRKKRHLKAIHVAGVLLLSFVIVGLILFGLVPGFIKVAQWVELLCVNTLQMSYNSGVFVYVVLLMASMLWALWELNSQRSSQRIRLSVFLSVAVSGMLCMGSPVMTISLLAMWGVWMFVAVKKINVRIYNVIVWSIFVIFIGYSSYGVILIRANANPPMNQNAVDNLFSLESYLNREQYKAHPLLYGPTPFSERIKIEKETIDTVTGECDYSYNSYYKKQGKPKFIKGQYGLMPRLNSGFATFEDSAYNSQLIARGGDCYLFNDYDYEYVTTPELNMILPRIFSASHIDDYRGWTGMTPENMDSVEVTDAVTESGEYVVMADAFSGERTARRLPKPTFIQNMSYLFGYQIGYMYMRYFLWNFCGRQNDLQSQGQADAGNFITGLPLADDAMLGKQSLMPDDIGRSNRGHNRYYMLPLLLGVLGIVWQCRKGKDGRRQAVMTFVLFFMTGIAIVIYLNQTPGEPRERDYAFAGSFYAFAIWIGVGVMMICKWVGQIFDRFALKSHYAAMVAVAIGLAVPVQMLSQTADDHDRSGRKAARDYAVNYLESLEPNAILFLNGDNFTFPLWYAQEVEGIRRDVRIINLAYLTTDWYAAQLMQPAYEADPVPTIAEPKDIAMRRRSIAYFFDCDSSPVDALTSLREIYSDSAVCNNRRQPQVKHPVVTIPLDRRALVDVGLVLAEDTADLPSCITIDMRKILSGRTSHIRMDELLMLDIISTNAAEGWKRPIYWTNICRGKELLGFTPYLRQEGMAYRLIPISRLGNIAVDTERTLRAVEKFQWGGADADEVPYFDDTNGKMLSYQRRMLADLANTLLEEAESEPENRERKAQKALEVLNVIEEKLPQKAYRYMTYMKNYVPKNEAIEIGQAYIRLAELLDDDSLKSKGLEALKDAVSHAAIYYRYYHSLGKRAVYTTNNTGLTARNFFMTIDAYRSAGGDMSQLEALPELKGIDLATAENNWKLYYIRQTLLNDARALTSLSLMSERERLLQSPELLHADSTMSQRIERYVELGGTIENLKTFAEFSEFPFEKYMITE